MNNAAQKTVPLVVDVDGALLHGDLLAMGARQLLARAPLAVFALGWHLLRGRARLKHFVAASTQLPPQNLQLNKLVLREIETARADGREIWLASGSDARAVAPLARRVAADGYLASDGRVNLVGRAKANALAEKFSAFDYIGDARRDFAVWRRARHAIGVNLRPRLKRRLRAMHAGAKFLDLQNTP